MHFPRRPSTKLLLASVDEKAAGKQGGSEFGCQCLVCFRAVPHVEIGHKEQTDVGITLSLFYAKTDRGFKVLS